MGNLYHWGCVWPVWFCSWRFPHGPAAPPSWAWMPHCREKEKQPQVQQHMRGDSQAHSCKLKSLSFTQLLAGLEPYPLHPCSSGSSTAAVLRTSSQVLLPARSPRFRSADSPCCSLSPGPNFVCVRLLSFLPTQCLFFSPPFLLTCLEPFKRATSSWLTQSWALGGVVHLAQLYKHNKTQTAKLEVQILGSID